jgi:hypothetical protein
MGDLTGSVGGAGAGARGYEEVLLRLKYGMSSGLGQDSNFTYVQTVVLLCLRVHLTGLSV